MRNVKGRPGANTATAPQLTADHPSPTEGHFDFDQRVVAQVEWSIWRAINRGELRLGVPCRRCGRVLFGKSRRNGIGDHCAAKAGA